jgi:glycosyltransferase involved in cell wall biosynthesis
MQPEVLMVTGAYAPEVSGAGLQCRALVGALQGRVPCRVLTTSGDRSLPRHDEIEGVPVTRIPIDVTRPASRLMAGVRLCRAFVAQRDHCDIVHLHGFSQKSLLVIALAKLFRKKVVIKLTSAGHDDPQAVRSRSAWRYRWYRQADLFIGTSPRLQVLYRQAELPAGRFMLIPNGVDVRRFRPPADDGERAHTRRALGLEADSRWTLCVGFFSREKHPDAVYDAWAALRDAGHRAGGLIFIGATRSAYYEVDPSLAETIRHDALRRGWSREVVFVERTDRMEDYYRAADAFVLASSREGLPNALLEAMASGLPCIVSRLEGITDSVIADGVNGLLVPPADPGPLAQAWARILDEPELARRLGREARAAIEARYGLGAVSQAYAQAYRALINRTNRG